MSAQFRFSIARLIIFVAIYAIGILAYHLGETDTVSLSLTGTPVEGRLLLVLVAALGARHLARRFILPRSVA